MTSLVKRFTDNEFLNLDPPPRFGFDFKKYQYNYENIVCKMNIWILHGNKRYYNINTSCLKNSNIIVYVIDISLNDSNINELFINDLFVNCKNSLKYIYLVLTKIDICEKDLNQFRKIAQKLIIDGIIYRYFEVSSKTGEGIESFRKCLKYDNAFIAPLVLDNEESESKNFHKKLGGCLNF